MSFTKCDVKGDIPTERALTGLVKIAENKVLIFGGCRFSEANQDTYVLNLESLTWTKVVTTGSVPCARWGHSLTAIGSRVFLFGGETIGGKYLNDIYILDTTTFNWTQPDITGISPTPRMCHSATNVKDKYIFFYGGEGVEDVNQSLITLDLDNMKWINPQQGGEGPPEPRKGHSAAFHKTKLYIFSGWGTKVHEHLDEVWSFDLQSKNWTKLKKKGPQPQPRVGSLSWVMKDMLYVWGGMGPGPHSWNDIHYMDIDDSSWSKRKGQGVVPGDRYYASACLIGDTSVLIFGGQLNQKEYTNEVYILNTQGIY